MCSIIAASVVVLPDPVGPVTRMRPRTSSERFLTTGGSPISSKIGPLALDQLAEPAPELLDDLWMVLAVLAGAGLVPSDRPKVALRHCASGPRGLGVGWQANPFVPRPPR